MVRHKGYWGVSKQIIQRYNSRWQFAKSKSFGWTPFDNHNCCWDIDDGLHITAAFTSRCLRRPFYWRLGDTIWYL